jgi:ATP-binding cassette subfamily B protein
VLNRLLLTHLRPYRGTLAVIVALQTVQTMATLTLPTLNADIIDKGIALGDTDYIWRMGAVMLGVTFVQVVFAIGATYFSARVAMAFGRDVRRDLFHAVTGYSAREVALHGAPSLITRLTNDVTQVQMLVLMGASMLLAAPIMMAGGVIMAVREDGPLSLLLLVCVPALAGVVGLLVVRLVPQYQHMQERIDRINQILREQITGIRVVRAFVREPEETERFRAANDQLTLTALRAGRLMAFAFPAVMLIMNLSTVAALWLGGDRIASGQLQIGALIAFLSYLIQILMSVVMATFVVVMIPRASVSAERIQEALDTESSVRSAQRPVTTLGARNTVVLDAAELRYPGAEAPVLSGISLQLEPGTTTALIGSTGSGKTTLVNLIPRLFDVTAGTVRVDGTDVRDLDLELLWSHIGLVPQKPYLFSGTVASNLRFAKADATDDELWEALRIAQADGFVEAMPDGLDTAIAQGGTSVSGGQRQRLSIARALVRRPPILLFDDAFSALDLATDARLRAALAPLARDRTTLVVAQRVTSIMHADQILVLEDGRAVGLGTHGELLERCATYAEIVDSQLSAEEAA